MITRTLNRLSPAMAMAAMLLALLALVATAAGAGYAAGKIGTKQIKNNAITTPKIKNNAVKSNKVKNGSLKAKDLVKEEKYKTPTLLDGGEGDCKWVSAQAEVPGVGLPSYRLDRFDRVHVSGIALMQDAPGGDATCDSDDAGQIADAIAFILPAKYVPAKTLYVNEATLIIGVNGYTNVMGSLPPGAVVAAGSGAIILDGMSFDSAGSKVSPAKTAPSGRFDPSGLKALSND